MKKIKFLLVLFVLFLFVNACADYKPIFGQKNLNFKIADYSIDGSNKLGNRIYSKLYNLSRANKNNEQGARSIILNIKVTKEKVATTKDSAGKILEYKINLNTQVNISDYLTNDTLLNKNFISGSAYKVQDQHSETIKLENKLMTDLIDNTYENLLINLSESILAE